MRNVKENIPLAPLTTFGIGGPARYLVDVKNEEDIRAAIEWAKERGVQFIILAGKSNVLAPDEGLNALVIHLVEGHFSLEGTSLVADAGCNLLKLIRECAKQGLGGWEKLAGIPGTIGGAVRGNAGAFGSEIKDFLVSAHAMNIETGEVCDFTNEECNFSYRQSFFKIHPGWIITRVQVRLAQADREESRESIEETIVEREKRHIQNVRAAGSFFVNPVASQEIQEMFESEKQVKSREGRVPAGWLIEKANMKGARIGDAVASEQHPNYLKNDGNATAKDVLALAEKIKKAVYDQFDIELKEEAAILS